MIIGFLSALLAIPEAELATKINGRDVFPRAFIGTWAFSLKACEDESIVIEEGGTAGYESEAVLLKHTGMIHHDAPDGKEAYTVVALMAESGEGQVGIGQLRISRVGDRLFTSRADVVSEDDHWKYPNIRCPG